MNKAQFSKAKIAEFLDVNTNCAWSESVNGNLIIHGLNGTPRATVQRVVNAYNGQMRTQDLGDGIKVLVISRATR